MLKTLKINKIMGTTKTLSKQDEISLIEKLCNSDSYFAQYFKQDMGTMIRNIELDMAIENGTSWELERERAACNTEKAQRAHERELSLRLQDAKDEADERVAHKDHEINNLVETVLLTKNADQESNLKAWYGCRHIIGVKRNIGIEISNDEIDYLLDITKNTTI